MYTHRLLPVLQIFLFDFTGCVSEKCEIEGRKLGTRKYKSCKTRQWAFLGGGSGKNIPGHFS